MKYRIAHTRTTDGLGNVKEEGFFIQVKFLFWWFKYFSKSCSSVAKKYEGQASEKDHGMVLEKFAFLFNKKEDAEYHLNEFVLNNPVINHHGHKIEKRLSHDFKIVFIDKSWKLAEINNYTNYKFSDSLVSLQDEISKTKVKLKTIKPL